MIISHKHKFIFLHAPKTAGTSIEIALSRHCGKEDVITRNLRYTPGWDSDEYTLVSQNSEGYTTHMDAESVKEKVGKEVWDSYFKFTVARNPWDYCVSRFYWDGVFMQGNHASELGKADRIFSNLLNPKAYAFALREMYIFAKGKMEGKSREHNFDFFVKNSTWSYISNDKYYFMWDGSASCDFYIRFEELEEGYKEVCNKIGIPYRNLLKTKDKIRKSKSYTDYYDEELRDVVSRRWSREIEFFGYEFEGRA